METVFHGEQLVAIIIRSDYRNEGIQFFTPSDFSQQLACMTHKAGKIIEPHVHNPVTRSVRFTQEVLLLRRGKLRIDFYTDQREYMESRILHAGDVILLASGGHGFEVLEEIEMIEVKQGPYAGDQDKTRFEGIDPSNIRVHHGQ